MPETKQELIEVAPVKLTVEESRTLMRCAVAGKPVKGDYRCAALVDLGILREVKILDDKEHPQKVAECWKRARAALNVKDSESLHQAMHDLERLNTDRDRNQTTSLYELTTVGKQLTRGISVRMQPAAAKTGK